jgi:hypothetical protein
VNVQRPSRKRVGSSRSEVGSILPDKAEDGDMVCSCMKVQAGVLAHRVKRVGLYNRATLLDNKGDTMSLICVLSEESRSEIRNKLNSRDFYVGVNNKMNFSAGDDVLELTLANMTG